ncbi:MAG: Gfo/Idh/MocA family oxidoreductase, partial [Fidelibacterota bacterium]
MKKVALVGCGRISKRHIEAISDTDGVELVLVCDIEKERAKTVAGVLDLPYETDYRKIKNVDVISVLTPSGDHPRHVADIAEHSDVPYIVCEKPVSLTVREAHQMFSRIDRTGKTFLPVYQNRYNPLIVLVKNLIDDNKLGTVYQFICNVLWNRNDAYFDIDWHGTRALDGGVLYTQASHYVDMVHYFFGELVSGKGQG